jgi:proteasome lid subunit RPN8/RPN11
MTDNEVGGFGITLAEDLLFVMDFALVKQKVSAVSVSFEDESVADFFADQVEAGRKPEQFARVWLHTHPGSSPEPSMTDEATFTRVFGNCDWSIMCIVDQDSGTFARLRFSAGPGGEVKIPVCVDYGFEFDAADFELWTQQYKANVTEDTVLSVSGKDKKANARKEEDSDFFGGTDEFQNGIFSSDDLMEELEMMHPAERQAFMDELAVRSDFWDEETEVLYG